MTIVSETRSAWQIEQGKKCGCRGLDDYCPCQNTDRTTAAPPTNTAGLVAEIDAEMQGRRRGYADVRGELLFRCRDSLVTAASAQARMAELETERDDADRRAGAAERLLEGKTDSIIKRERWLRDAKEARGYHQNISFDRVWADTCAAADRAQAAEDRADRLADGITAAMLILTPEPGDKPLTEREKMARQLLAALQQEG